MEDDKVTIKCPHCGEELQDQVFVEGAVAMCFKCHEHFTMTKDLIVGEKPADGEDNPADDDKEDPEDELDGQGEDPGKAEGDDGIPAIPKKWLAAPWVCVAVALIGGAAWSFAGTMVGAAIWLCGWLEAGLAIGLAIPLSRRFAVSFRGVAGDLAEIHRILREKKSLKDDE